MATNESKQNGVGFLGILSLIFITLKLTNTIDWSWWWVLSPLWAVPAIMIVIVILALIYLKIKKILGR